MKKALIITSLSLLSVSSFAKAKTKSFCSELSECVEKVSQLTNKKYIYDGKGLKGKVTLTKNYKVDADNADYFISQVLNLNGYSRRETKEGFQIVSSRDIRYTPVKQFKVGVDTIPRTHDYIMASLELKGIDSTEITRAFRPFMSRYGRLISIKQNNSIIIQDTGENVIRMVKMAQGIDFEPTREQLRERKKEKERSKKLRMIKAKNCSYLESEIRSLGYKIDKLKKD